MAERVARAVESGRHVIVQAGTGTGKTLAYLVPLVMSAQRVVVATATKALQDQLATKDLPFLDQHLPVPFEWAVLKGRSNYLCLQRLREVNESADGQLELDGMASTTKAEIKRLASWAGSSPTGDQAELDWTPSDTAWRSVSVGSDECPGAERCPLGQQCFAELARRRAGAADVIVVNTHLYGLHVASGGMILPEHDVVVFDEAHGLEDIMSDTVGVTIAPSRFVALAAIVRRILDDPALIASVTELAELLGDAIGPLVGQRLPDTAARPGRRVPRRGEDPTRPDRRGADRDRHPDRGRQTAQAPRPDDDRPADRVSSKSLSPPTTDTSTSCPVRPSGRDSRSRRSTSARRCRTGCGATHVAILTSATIPSSLAERVGLPADGTDVADVGSPFDYPANALLYCARHLPDPRSEKFRPAVHEELAALITAAGGRTLALFTSWRAMDEAAAAVRATVPYTILTQRDLPKPALVRAFAADAETCLFATAGLFQGVDVPGLDALARRDRPDPVPPARRSAAVGAPRAARPGGVRPDRPAAGSDAARPGVRTSDP